MEVAAATATSFTTLRARTSAVIPSSARSLRSKGRFSSSSSLRFSLSNGFLSSYTGVSISSDFCGAKLRAESLNPLIRSSSKPKRGVVVIWLLHETIAVATEQSTGQAIAQKVESLVVIVTSASTDSNTTLMGCQRQFTRLNV